MIKSMGFLNMISQTKVAIISKLKASGFNLS